MTKNLDKQSGQVALIVLLIMGVTLVIAVSLAQRTTEDVALTTKQAETTKVFSAAQSGAEQKLTEVLTALRAGNPVNTSPATLPNINEATVNVAVDTLTEFIQPLDEGETYQVSLPNSGSVLVEWGNNSGACANEASLLVARYNTTGGVTTVQYSGYYPSGGCTGTSDGFTAAIGGSNGRRSAFSYTVAAGDEFLRIIPIYNSTDLYVSGAANPQYAVTADATNTLGENQESRVVQVTTSDLQPPSFLDYAVYSGTTITK